jgi:hypothetical protein
MNERIKELALQAADYANTYRDAGADVWFEIYNKKFAELIVAECIEQVITGPNGPAHYAVEAAIRLKKHFRVEE